MERKLIAQGLGGLTIYLPKKWADKKGLKEGNTVDIKEKDSSLVVSSAKKEKKEIRIEINDENRKEIKNILTHLYRNGFDSIVLSGNIDESTANEIKKITGLLLGFEITEKSREMCKLENISEPTEEKYNAVIRRVYLIIQESIAILEKDYESGKFKNNSEMKELRNNADKFILFCRRTLSKEKYEKNPVAEWELLTFLMHIQHNLGFAYNHASEHKIEQDKQTKELIEKLKKYFELYYEAYFKKDIKYIHQINNLRNELPFGLCLTLLKKSKGDTTIFLSYLREVFRLIQVGTSPLLGEILEKRLAGEEAMQAKGL